MKLLGKICGILLLIGGLNWGLVGLFNLDVISAVFGSQSALTRIIFILVGLSAIYKIYECCGKCGGSCSTTK
jgi:uncharacterized protein